MADLGRGAKGLLALGVLAAGVAAGALTERIATRRLHAGEYVGIESAAGITHEVITDDGVALRVVEETGDVPADAPTVIFSHGYGLSLDSWPGQREALRGAARVVLWDQRGHGGSQRGVPGTTVERLGADLGCVLDAVAPTGVVVLVGHSMGGMTIMALADQRPELFGDRVRGVALLATSAGGIADVDLGLPRPVARLAHRVAPSIGAALESDGPVSALVERARRSSSDLGLLVTRAYAFGATVPPDGTRIVSDLIAGTPVDVLADLLPALQGHDKVAALHVLERCELLVMVGDSDLLTPVGHSYEIVRHTPSAELVILPGVGHMLTLEAVDDVNKHLRALVERVA
jgi:pimeloyl-ACP methyl ester carboxylesterase